MLVDLGVVLRSEPYHRKPVPGEIDGFFVQHGAVEMVELVVGVDRVARGCLAGPEKAPEMERLISGDGMELVTVRMSNPELAANV